MIKVHGLLMFRGEDHPPILHEIGEEFQKYESANDYKNDLQRKVRSDGWSIVFLTVSRRS